MYHYLEIQKNLHKYTKKDLKSGKDCVYNMY